MHHSVYPVVKLYVNKTSVEFAVWPLKSLTLHFTYGDMSLNDTCSANINQYCKAAETN